MRGLGQRDTDALIHCPNWMFYMVLLFGIHESGVLSNVVWTSSEVLKSGSDLTISLSVDVGLEICFIGP
jgi:hypothetical protein